MFWNFENILETQNQCWVVKQINPRLREKNTGYQIFRTSRPICSEKRFIGKPPKVFSWHGDEKSVGYTQVTLPQSPPQIFSQIFSEQQCHRGPLGDSTECKCIFSF